MNRKQTKLDGWLSRTAQRRLTEDEEAFLLRFVNQLQLRTHQDYLQLAERLQLDRPLLRRLLLRQLDQRFRRTLQARKPFDDEQLIRAEWQ